MKVEETEIKKKMEEALDMVVNPNIDESEYYEGVAQALGWVLGLYDDPMEE